jgi:hypothetical protein
MVKLYEVGVIYKEDESTHRESELLVFQDPVEAEDYIRRGAIKALFTLIPIEKLTIAVKKFFKVPPEAVTGEMIDQISKDDAIKIFEILKKIAENPTVDKFYIEEVTYFEDSNGNKFPIEVKNTKIK